MIRRSPMFIAMNRFRVAKGSEKAFENVWLSRDSYLDIVPGFVGPEAEDHTLYASHTVWESTPRPQSVKASAPPASRSIMPLTTIVVTISPGIAVCFQSV